MAPPSGGNTATSSQVQALANQVGALQASVNALGQQVQTYATQGTAAVNALSAKIDILIARSS